MRISKEYPLSHPNRLIIFTRYPQPGRTKTRLIPALGAEGAAILQRQMTEHTLRQVSQLSKTNLVMPEIWYAASQPPFETGKTIDDRTLMEQWLGNQWHYQPQHQGDLGERLIHAFEAAFATGAERVVAIGTDCPSLDSTRLQQAFESLQEKDLVLGRATDGGYYLIGLRRSIPALFQGIAWGTDTVLQQTRTIGESLNLDIITLEPLTDIDRLEDLSIWQQVKSRSTGKISIIIPVVNEAPKIQTALQSLQQVAEQAIEIIVVDGSSEDHTVDLARETGARETGVTVITTPRGRAKQMNIGAQIATGEILLFLHSDTNLPAGFADQIRKVLAQPDVIAGAFELQIQGKEFGLRIVEWGVKWRSSLLQLPYGDQAVFLRARTFHQIEGFSEMPIMEDFEMIRRLQKLGQIAIVPCSVVTSGRRWQKLGVIRTTLINQAVIIGYLLGIPSDRLVQWYQGNRKDEA